MSRDLEIQGSPAGICRDRPEDPGEPLEEDGLHPARQLVRLHRALVEIEDEDGADHAARHHHLHMAN